MKTNKYAIRDREAGNVIDEFPTANQALKALAQYEKSDKADGTYTEGFYEVIPILDRYVHLYQKKSGNYAFSTWNAPQTKVNTNSPRILKHLINGLPRNSVVILAEYSRSNRYTASQNFNERNALNVFGFAATKADISIHFNL